MQRPTRSWRECVGFEPLGGYQDGENAEAILWLDIDLMADRIRNYFKGLGLSENDAEQLHSRYYKEYGLAIRGLVKHHTIDPMDYDEKCDRSLPLEQVLKPDQQLIQLLQQIDQRKVRVYALTNAYKALLNLDEIVQGVVYCDYTIPDFSCKPESEFYLAAQQAVNASPSAHVYFVDDSMSNIVAAQSLGWKSCLFFDEMHPIQSPVTGPNGVTRISSLMQLPDAWPSLFPLDTKS